MNANLQPLNANNFEKKKGGMSICHKLSLTTPHDLYCLIKTEAKLFCFVFFPPMPVYIENNSWFEGSCPRFGSEPCRRPSLEPSSPSDPRSWAQAVSQALPGSGGTRGIS